MSDENLPETTHGDRTPVGVDEPIANPGLEPHQWRPTDVDPKAEKRAERQVAGLFVLAMVGTVLFVVSYIVFKIGPTPDTFGGLGASNVALGVSLAVTLLAMGAGVIQWARKLMADHEIVEMRHTASSPQEDREATVGILADRPRGVRARPSAADPQHAAGCRWSARHPADRHAARPRATARRQPRPHDLGPGHVDPRGAGVVGDPEPHPDPRRPRRRRYADQGLTTWRSATWSTPSPRSSSPSTTRANRSSRAPGCWSIKSKAAVILNRMVPEDIVSAQTLNWSVDGIVCYSKICTHVGCPISLNERTTHHLLCPCHQSTFDLTDSGRVLFGPAAQTTAAAGADGRRPRATSLPSVTSTNPSDRASGSVADHVPRHEQDRDHQPRGARDRLRAEQGRRGRHLGRRPARAGHVDAEEPAQGLPRPLVVHARRDRAVELRGPAADGRVPDLLVQPEHVGVGLPGLVHAAARRTRCPMPTPRRCTSRSTCAAAC